MNFFQLIFKQMRQRALSTWLTMFSVMLGVALAVCVLLVRQGGVQLFFQSDFGYDVIVGPAKGSPLQLTLNTVYHIDRSPGTFNYMVYEQLRGARQAVRHAIPLAVGDTVDGLPVVGTTPSFFGYDDEGKQLPEERRFKYRKNRSHALAQGVMFHPEKFQSVVGADVLKRLNKKIGDTFQITHGNPTEGASKDIHSETWTIVGVLEKTNTAADRALYIPLISFYAIPEHEEALEAIAGLQSSPSATPQKAPTPTPAPKAAAKDDHGHDHDHAHAYHMDGDLIHLDLPKEQWRLSAVLVETRSPPLAMSLMYTINNRPEASAVNPASVMREFFSTFLASTTQVLFLLTILVTVVAAVGVLVSIYNSVSSRMKEIAILRALGATRGKVLSLITVEAALIGLFGGLLGVGLGVLLGAAGSSFLRAFLGEGFDYLNLGKGTVYYVAGTVVLAALAGLIPALKAYRVPVSTNLSA